MKLKYTDIQEWEKIMLNRLIPFIPLIISIILTIVFIFLTNDYSQSYVYHVNATGVKSC